MQSSISKQRQGALRFAVVLFVSLAAALALSAALPSEAVAGGRASNVTVTKDTATAYAAKLNMTAAPKASAASRQSFAEQGSFSLKPGATGDDSRLDSKYEVQNLKYSNPKIVELEFSESYEYNGKWSSFVSFTAIPLKAGSTTVTFIVKSGDIVRTCKLKVKVSKYDKAFSTFKVGNANLAKKLDATGATVELAAKKLSGKLTMKAAKNWKVLGATFYGAASAATDWRQPATELSSGKNYTLKNGRIVAILQNTKDKRYRNVIVQLAQTNASTQYVAAKVSM